MRELTDLEQEHLEKQVQRAQTYAIGWGDGAGVFVNFYEFGIYYAEVLTKAILNEAWQPFIAETFKEWRQKNEY